MRAGIAVSALMTVGDSWIELRRSVGWDCRAAFLDQSVENPV